ncbi:MAG: Eco57I restriction-modification methylase domain-containing protein, partial [Thermoflexibacteraceae bacterium]
QKLNDLQDNIKCGNSLIEDEDFYDKIFDWRKSFDWQTSFPQILAHQGFTVIVGNPPYVRQENMSSKHKKYYAQRYPTVYHSGADLYVYFYAKSLELLQPNGILAFITPNKWFKTQYGENLRKILQPFEIQKIIDFFELPIFTDASTEPQIIILKNTQIGKEFDYFPITKEVLEDSQLADFAKKMSKKLVINKQNLQATEWVFASPKAQQIIDKMQGKTSIKTVSLKEYTNSRIYRGITTGLNKAFIIDSETKHKLIAKDARSAELIKPYAQPTSIKKWEIEEKNSYFFINTGFDVEISSENYFAIYEYLKQFDKELTARQDKGKTQYNLRACDYYEEFKQPKIIYIHTAVNHHFYYDTEGFYVNNSCYLIADTDRFLATFLNSKLFDFYKRLHFVAYGNAEEKGRNKLDYNKMLNVPIPILTEEQKQSFVEKIEKALEENQKINKLTINFYKVLQSQFPYFEPTEKLTNWYTMNWRDFVKEMKKSKVDLTLRQQMGIMDMVDEYLKVAQTSLEQIDHLDRLIDQQIYALYDLTKEEIRIVENG